VVRQQYSPVTGETLDPTEARQASPRKTNFRVLVISTLLTAVILGGFVIAFVYSTPPRMSGNLTTTAPQSTPTQGSPPQGKPLPSAPDTYNPGDAVQH
jgi:hypothetical protein